MAFYLYILQSLKDGHYYVGSAEDVQRRLKRHNAGLVRATKKGVPWKVVYGESFPSRSLAYRRERQIKTYHGGEAFRKLILTTKNHSWVGTEAVKRA